MTKTEIKDRERYKRVGALKGLSQKQKIFVQNFNPTEPLTVQARNAGYTNNVATHRIYDYIKQPRLKRALELYHDIKDDGVGKIAVGTVLDIMTDSASSEEGRINSAKLGLQIAGKLKNINVNANFNADIPVTVDLLSKILCPDSPDRHIPCQEVPQDIERTQDSKQPTQ